MKSISKIIEKYFKNILKRFFFEYFFLNFEPLRNSHEINAAAIPIIFKLIKSWFFVTIFSIFCYYLFFWYEKKTMFRVYEMCVLGLWYGIESIVPVISVIPLFLFKLWTIKMIPSEKHKKGREEFALRRFVTDPL